MAGPEGWRIVAAAEAVEAAGMDAGAVLAETASADVDGLVVALDRIRFSGADPLGRARPAPLAAGVLAAPGPQVTPDVAAWQTSLARRLESWRDSLASRLAAGEDPPTWAAPLGAPPPDPDARNSWAAAVAQVALYRATHRVDDDSLLGPDVALGTLVSRARAVASAASARAGELGGTAAQPDHFARSPAGPAGRKLPPPSADRPLRPGRS